MGKKSPEERRAAHAKFEQRQASKGAVKTSTISLTDEQVRAAATHAIGICIETASEKSNLPQTVLKNIANGRFTAEGQQVDNVVKAATAMGWAPEVH